MDTTLVRLLEEIHRLTELLLDQEPDEEGKYQIVLSRKVLTKYKTAVAEEIMYCTGSRVHHTVGAIVKQLDTIGNVLVWDVRRGQAIEAATRIFQAGGKVIIERMGNNNDQKD